MKRRIWLIAGILVVALVSMLVYHRWLRRPTTENTTMVERGTIQATVDALGRVEPKKQLGLATRITGTVDEILVQEGDKVRQGQALLKLDALQYQDAVDRAERTLALARLRMEEALEAPSASQIKVVEARLRRATVARQNAQSDYDEIADDPDADSSDEAVDLQVAKLEYQLAKAEFDRVMEGTSHVELEYLKGQIKDAKAALQQAQDRLEHTRIRAPFDGTVLRVEPLVGQLVFDGSILIQFADLTRLQINAEINEIDIPSIAQGQEVSIRLDAFANRLLSGHVNQVLPGATDTRGATTYRAYITFDCESLPVRPGMGANLTITTQTVKDALLIPQRAVVRVGLNQIVQVYRKGRFQKTIITTGLSNEIYVQVLAGLEKGEIILLD